MLKASARLGVVAWMVMLAACAANTNGARMGGVPAAAAASGVSEAATSSELVTLLVNQTGVSKQQAAGGAGSIFSLAKQRLSPADFSKVANAVPEMNSLLAAVPGGVSPGSGIMGDLSGMAGVVSNFQALGLGQDMVSRFIPVILNYVQQQGGTSVMNLLQGALL
jgi:hypothetical protein